MTSIIECLFDFTRVIRHTTAASLADVRRFTDDGDYELIIIDNVPTMPIDDPYKVIRLDQAKVLVNEVDAGCYASLNQGARVATGDYLLFLQPDVFVHEGWLKNLRYYIENNIYDVVFPDQFPATRKDILERYEMSYEEASNHGGRDAGCIMMTREGFDKTGGWDETMEMEYGEAAFYDRIDKAGLRWGCAGKSLVTHIGAGTKYTMWDLHPEIHIKQMEHDANAWAKIRNPS